MIQTIGVSKKFDDVQAVNSLSLEIRQGEVFGLVGTNGAGKSTLLRMLCGILKPTSGRICCNGQEIGDMGSAYRRLLGYLPHDFGYYPGMTAERYLHYLAELKAVPPELKEQKVTELLELVELGAQRRQRIKTFSGGMLRRLGIAQAMLNDPQILILDEPTAGLDPKERIRFRNLISKNNKNRIVLLSTHIVSDVEFIADELVLMKQGEIIRTGTVEEIIAGAGAAAAGADGVSRLEAAYLYYFSDQ